jgi:galactose-1-phosphate uridylyltransferase
MIKFRKKVEESTYLNPFNNFQPHNGQVEIRWDPLTALTARVVRFPARKFERFPFESTVSSSLAAKCPFCDENVNNMTAKLDETVYGRTHIEHEGVRIIPNLLTFDKHSLVAILSKTHHLDVAGLAGTGVIVKGIKALIHAFRYVKKNDRRSRYFSINCNYMPMSGGSLVHPHMQGIAGEHPTNYHRIMLTKSRGFFRRNNHVFWNVLKKEEKKRDERFIGETGRVFWYAPFAPRGNTDIGFLVDRTSIFSVSDREWTDFGTGIKKVFAYLDSQNVGGFNLSIFSGIDGEGYFKVNGRLVARRFLPPVNAADVNYLEKIHMETACLVAPEKMAKELRETW